jgi:hypothetical protein
MIRGLEGFIPDDWKNDGSSIKLHDHLLMVARAARAIAGLIPELDQDRAFDLGLFHDVGKFGIKESEKYKHPRKGYELMKGDDIGIANVCISHPFPIFDYIEYIRYYCKGDADETLAISRILANVDENDMYVRLIQFCDKASTADGYVSISDKFAWYAEKYTPPDGLISRNYEKLMEIKGSLDKLSGHDVYDVLQGVEASAGDM